MDYPVYKTTSAGLSIKQILNVCVGQNIPQKICSRVPSMVDRSAVFVIDLSRVHHKDLSADECGIYDRHSSPSQTVHVHLDDENNVVSFENVEKGQEKTSKYTRQSTLIVRRQYRLNMTGNFFSSWWSSTVSILMTHHNSLKCCMATAFHLNHISEPSQAY